MSEGFAPATVHEFSRGVGRVTHGSDDDCVVRFYKNPINDKDYVQINFPGDRKTEVKREVRNTDKERWPRHWQRYQEGHEGIEGTLIEEWGIIPEGRWAELHFMNIHTVEQLAAVDDGRIGDLGPGARDLRQRAIEFVAKQEKLVAYDEQDAKIAELEGRIEEMMAQQREYMAEAVNEKPKRRGRPPKE